MKLYYFTAHRKDGSVVYGGPISPSQTADNGEIDQGEYDEKVQETIAFYTDGHPHVFSFKLRTLETVEEKDIPVKRTASRIKAWHKRTGR